MSRAHPTRSKSSRMQSSFACDACSSVQSIQGRYRGRGGKGARGVLGFMVMGNQEAEAAAMEKKLMGGRSPGGRHHSCRRTLQQHFRVVTENGGERVQGVFWGTRVQLFATVQWRMQSTGWVFFCRSACVHVSVHGLMTTPCDCDYCSSINQNWRGKAGGSAAVTHINLAAHARSSGLHGRCRTRVAPCRNVNSPGANTKA